ncbi:MAG: 3-hydroxyacyl-CoA dehydrogenase [Luteitalea sp.]|nr:3-hydroxyacyl-CoA dehydrogenase [Luteitalea sp.]
MTHGISIRTAAVLGAGTMGAQIAAHLANAGVPVLLLDLTAEIAGDGLKRALGLKPDPFFTRDTASLITVGGLDRDFGGVAAADWIVEAVVEQLDVKRALFERLETTRRPQSVVSSNTSGIPIAALAEGRSEDFRRHLLGTHFFNPPRYLRLVEVIPTPETGRDVVDRITDFAVRRLGKGVVVAKDTPNFIANHIGLYGVIQTLRMLDSGDYTIEEIDAITGPALGRPKSATFRTMDIAGIDVLGHVARNLAERVPGAAARSAFTLPPLVQALIDRGWIGEKAGQGFYRRDGSDILTLDPGPMAYRPKQPARLPALEAVRSVEDVRDRLRTLFTGSDKVGAFLRQTLGPLLLYTAEVTPSIAHTIDDVDCAMKWGFGWELGPFEIWDALGIQTVLDQLQPRSIPPLVEGIRAAGGDRFRAPAADPPCTGPQLLPGARDRSRVLRTNAGASLIDLGDDVLAVAFHAKMNAIGGDTVQMLQAGLKEAAANFAAVVIGTDAQNFSVGANLMLVLLEAQEGNWDDIDLMVRTFQATTQAMRYSAVPVVVAAAGLALGGGCEIALHGDRVQAAAESYLGLVEVGVGLIPAGGGTKETVRRATLHCDPRADVLRSVQVSFETIAFAKVSTSAAHARQLGYLRDVDGVSMNRDGLIAEAKRVALEMAREGYAPPPRRLIQVGGESVTAALKLGVHLAWRGGGISEHDALIGRTLATVIGGGSLPHAAGVSEAYLLDLEREAFLKLCGEPKTLARMQHTLKTGKPLRN